MATFTEELHELCNREAQAALGDLEASAAMTEALISQLANAIAVLTLGQSVPSRHLVKQSLIALPQIVFEKCILVREKSGASAAKRGRS